MAGMKRSDLMKLLKADAQQRERLAQLREEARETLAKAAGGYDIHPKALNLARFFNKHPEEIETIVSQITQFGEWLSEAHEGNGRAADAGVEAHVAA
jgi:hypothetical protein